jgi:PHD/YefM family antitoxin component YafN of YafNO toxin-antitoxin module
MIIKPSTALRNEYNDIAKFCKEKMQPVFLTKNGEGDLVVMSIETYLYREEMLDLREKLLEAEAAKISGVKTYTIEEVSKRLKELIHENEV